MEAIQALIGLRRVWLISRAVMGLRPAPKASVLDIAAEAIGAKHIKDPTLKRLAEITRMPSDQRDAELSHV